jgi:hypothetical protein
MSIPPIPPESPQQNAARTTSTVLGLAICLDVSVKGYSLRIPYNRDRYVTQAAESL